MKTEKKIEDYLHLYINAECVIEKVNASDQHKENFAKVGERVKMGALTLLLVHQKTVEVKLLLRPFSDMKKEEALEFIKILDDGLSDEPEFNITEKDGEDWVYEEVGYEGTMCSWSPNKQYLQSKMFHLFLQSGFDLFGLIESGLAIDKTTIE